MSAFSDKLRELRKERGETQVVASAGIGLRYATLVNLECGYYPPKPEALAEIASYYGVRVEDLPSDGSG